MAQSTGDGYASGTAATMCAISPSDEVGIINNLLTRIEKMEQALNALGAINIRAGRLSDLSQQIGWVYGIDYMGATGWAQTEYGSLVPPPGFTLSGAGFTMTNACTGETTPYQGVITNADGVLQFGWTPVGDMCGEKVQAWDAAAAAPGAAPDYAVSRYRDNTPVDPITLYESSRGITITASTPTSDGDVGTLTVTQSGVYFVTCNFSPKTAPSAGSASLVVYAGTLGSDNEQRFGDLHSFGTGGGNLMWQASGFIVCGSAGMTINCLYDAAAGSPTTGCSESEFSVYRIGAV